MDDSTLHLDARTFWNELYPDLTIPPQIMDELSDFYFVMQEVPKVYYHVTGGQMSKCNYFSSSVISVADDHLDTHVEECLRTEMEMMCNQLGIEYADEDDYNDLREKIIDHKFQDH